MARLSVSERIKQKEGGDMRTMPAGSYWIIHKHMWTENPHGAGKGRDMRALFLDQLCVYKYAGRLVGLSVFAVDIVC